MAEDGLVLQAVSTCISVLPETSSKTNSFSHICSAQELVSAQSRQRPFAAWVSKTGL